jgi:hypothetical protein
VRTTAVFLGKFARLQAGTPLARDFGMALRRAHQAAIAAGSDGSVLINVVGLLPETLRAKLAGELGTAELFVGIPLSQKDATNVVNRLEGAAAEASAHLLGGRVVALPATARARPAKRAKSPAKRR